MDRPLCYPNSSALSESILRFAQSGMISDGALLSAICGELTTAVAWGLQATPSNPANMVVNIGAGGISSYQPVDANGYVLSTLTNTDGVTKFGYNTSTIPLDLTTYVPVTNGQSVNILIEARFDEEDGLSRVLTYKDPASGNLLQGPSGSGVAQATMRTQRVALQCKVGAPAASGSQVTPSPDTGWSGLYVVTLLHGQTSVVTISPYAGAPWLENYIVRPGALAGYARTSDVANAYVREAEVDTAGSGGSVVRRDASGGITAPAFHGVADQAVHASAADNATNSGHASTADNATHAGSADNATSAGSAATAGHASAADSATTANTALVANSSNTLTNLAPDVNATPSTVAIRDSGGNINAAHFNGEASSADFADFAERMMASEPMEPGDLVQFGGDNEIILATEDTGVWSVVSTAPAYLCNASARDDKTHPPIVTSGRVPVKVNGPVNKFDWLIPSDTPGVAVATKQQRYRQEAFARALESKSEMGQGKVLAFVQARF